VGLAEAPDDRGLERRRRGLDELSLIAEFRQEFLTGDTELLGEFVYPGLACHCSPHCEVTTAMAGRATSG